MAKYNKDTDYQALINQSVAAGKYSDAAQYEQLRNQKIADLDATGTNVYGAKQTNNYSQYLGAGGTNGNYVMSPGFNGSANNVYTYNSTQAGIQAQMNQNSQAWWDAYNAGNTNLMKSLEDANKALAAQLGGSVTYDPSTGYWSGAANMPVSVQTGVNVQKPTWDLNSYMQANPMPTYQGLSVEKPTWSGYDVQKPTYSGYDVEKPVYSSQYQTQIDAMLNEILNREAFSYDAESDPLYQQYKKQYIREGNRAMNDTMSAAAINAGGMNTYAMTAAQQANDYYMAQLGDKIPELYQLAYSMYMDDLNNKRSDLDTLVGLDQNDYNKHRDEVSDWYNDRDFGYNQYRDQVGDWYNDRDFAYGEYRDQVGDYYIDRDFGYNQYRDQVNDWYNNRDFAYGNYRDDMSDYKWGTEFNYGVERDQIADQRYDQEWQYAISRDQIADQRYDQEWNYAVGRDQIADQRYANETAYERAMELLLSGIMPNSQLLAEAGISASEAAAIKSASTPTVTPVSPGGGGGKDDIGDKEEENDPTPTPKPNPSPTTSDEELDIDWESVNDLGYGPIGEEQIAALESAGKIELRQEGNKIKAEKIADDDDDELVHDEFIGVLAGQFPSSTLSPWKMPISTYTLTDKQKYKK